VLNHGSVMVPIGESDPVILMEVDGLGQRVHDRLVEALAAADEHLLKRIGRVGTSVAFHIDGEPGAACLLLCDRLPPVVEMGDRPAEASILLSADQARQFCAGELKLPSLLLDEEVGYEGAPRKFLRIEPIVRGLLFDTAESANVDP